MSFMFRGNRGDIENGFTEYIPERFRHAMDLGARRFPNAHSMAFLGAVLFLLFMILITKMSPNILLWLVLGVFLWTTGLTRMYDTCQLRQAQAHAHAAEVASGLLGDTEFRLRMPPSVAFASRGRLHGLRLQLSLLDREFDDLDYDALRALDAENSPDVPSMSEAEINALPLHTYKGPSSSSQSKSKTLRSRTGSVQNTEDELTCSVCLERVNIGDLLRSLPCLHQVALILGCSSKEHVRCVSIEQAQVGIGMEVAMTVMHLSYLYSVPYTAVFWAIMLFV